MTQNLFSDLIPQAAPKTRSVRGTVAPQGGNPFEDLVPAPVEEQEPQVPNIGAKGDMRPDDRVPSSLAGQFIHGAIPWQDEINSGMVSVPISVINALIGDGPTDIGENFQQQQARSAAERARTEEENPILAPTAEIAGAVTTLGGGARAILRRPGMVRQAVKGGAGGAAAGALYGSGDDSGEGRLANAKVGAGAGAVGGVLAPGVAKAVGAGYRLVRATGRAATAPLRALRNPKDFAATKVAEAAQRDGMSPARLQRRLTAATDLKDDAVLADVAGPNSRKLLRAAANVPSDARAGLTRNLQNRQEGQRGRLQNDVGEAFGDPAAFMGTVEALATARKTAAAPIFQRAFNTGTPWTPRLESVLQRPLTARLVNKAEEAAANRGEQFKSFYAKQQPGSNTYVIERVPDTEALHRVKMEIDNALRQLRRREDTGLGNVNIRDLTILKQHLVEAIDNPTYKQALRQYAGDSAAMNAIDEGFEEGLTMEPERITQVLARMSPSEAEMWRMGFARAIVNKLRDQGNVGVNRAEKLYSPKFMDRMQAVFRNPQERNRFLKKLNMERRMVMTRNAAEGNSTTAGQLVEGQEAAADAESVQVAADIGRKVARGDFVSALVSLAGRAKNTATGLRPEVADEIIRLLTTQDPVAIARAQAAVTRQTQALTRRQGAPARLGQSAGQAAFVAPQIGAQQSR